MAKKEISVFSLSLLDLLFCAFGGVIVLTVVFSAIIKYEQAQSEKSRQVAVSVNIEYSNYSGFPKRFILLSSSEIEIQPNPVLNNVFEGNSFLLFDEISIKENAKFQFALEGYLKPLLKDSILSDTLYLKILDPNENNPQDQLPSSSGQITISYMIYRQGELPEKSKLQSIPVNRLYRYDQSLPLIFSLNDADKLAIKTN